MNANKGVSLNPENRIPHQARTLRHCIIAFVLIDGEAEIRRLNAVTISLLY